MATNIKLLLDTRRARKDGSYPLVMRVIHDRKSINISLGYSLQSKDWDAKNERLKRTSQVVENTTRFNNMLHKKRTKAYDTIAKLDDEKKLTHLTMSELKAQLIENKTTSKPTVFQFIEEHITQLKKARKAGNADVYGQVLKRLRIFNNGKDLKFEALNYAFLTRFENWHFSNGSSVGSLSVYMRTIRAAYNKAIKSKIVASSYYPFNDYKIKSQTPIRRSLTEIEFKSLRDIALEQGSPLAHARNMFMASFFMRGMNWMDMALLKFSNIHGNFERIHYVRQKTGKPFSIKVSPALKTILFLYLPDNPKSDDFIFPIVKREDLPERYPDIIRDRRKRLNKRLKEIAALCEITPFTIYTARHTYATTGKRKGVPTAVIQESMGHATEEITQTYLDSFENSVIDEYDEIIMSQ
uniref:Site-specific integrase n=1 Tax=Roseihalotalea indica TaxID=2867963 RepID=A0AA49GIQ2_9BACT|nr:site-specific integrase [Tunicatimonas sp. TK19036]